MKNTVTTMVVALLFLPNVSMSQDQMAFIPSGIYTPLYEAQEDTLQIIVDPMNMDVYPVTNEDYLEFVMEYPKWKRSAAKRIFADGSYLTQWSSDSTFNEIVDQSPVTNISWFAARAYCKCKEKRLPTVAEWEYVAAASEMSRDGKNEDEYNQRILDWYSKPNPETLPAVGSTFKNYYGIYDMHGLVWEWVDDFNTALVTGESRGDSELNRNLFCGSGALGSSDFLDYPAFLRYGFRSSLKANYSVTNLGFRCVKNSKK